jgi:deazaflavin-dependent oxidoreductase (nitroreductase family)
MRPVMGSTRRHARSSRLLNVGAKSPLATRWTRLHAALYRRTGGKVLARWFGGPVMVLEIVGRRSGQLRSVPVMRVQAGDRYVVVPSNAGSDKTPAWWLNLRAAGEAWVVHGRRRIHVRPRVTEGTERAEMWERFAEVYPGIDDYTTFTDREWPVVVLEPAD